MDIGVLFTIIYFVFGIAYLLYVISHDSKNMPLKDWFVLTFLILVPIVICTYVVGLYINYYFRVPDRIHVYVYIMLFLFSAVIPVAISYIKYIKNMKAQKEYIKRLKKMKNNPNTTDIQKAQIDAVIDSNPFS